MTEIYLKYFVDRIFLGDDVRDIINDLEYEFVENPSIELCENLKIIKENRARINYWNIYKTPAFSILSKLSYKKYVD